MGYVYELIQREAAIKAKEIENTEDGIFQHTKALTVKIRKTDKDKKVQY